ncbi:response regulator [Lysobacter humi (ex Lee et al. 2017)]
MSGLDGAVHLTASASAEPAAAADAILSAGETPAQAAPAASASDLPLRGLRLLLVEDEFVLAVGLSDTLGDLGAEVVGPIASVADALALLETLPEIDGAVLDVNLGRETVYPVADALLARGLPFVFATANDPERLPERFRDVRVCRKPFDAATFLNAVQGLQPRNA